MLLFCDHPGQASYENNNYLYTIMIMLTEQARFQDEPVTLLYVVWYIFEIQKVNMMSIFNGFINFYQFGGCQYFFCLSP